jgi:formylglycine-generating enzyme required for sulfatase activity
LGRYEELGLVKVPAGEFLMGSTDEDQYAGNDEKPQHTVFQSTFYIGKYPVTVAQYRSFIQESQHKTSEDSRVNGIDNHPVVDVSWNDAMKFSQWHGMTLPSEAQWEKAARGTDGRIYPWGNDWRDGLANTDEYRSKGSRGLWARLQRRRNRGTTTLVGYFSPRGDSPYGCSDLSGNVWEWTSTIYREYPYKLDD